MYSHPPKVLAILFFLVAFFSCSRSAGQTDKYYPYRSGYYWGISDENGNLKVNPEFLSVQEKCGFFIGSSANGKFSLYNSQADFILKADSIIRTSGNCLLVLNFLPEYKHRDSSLNDVFSRTIQYNMHRPRSLDFANGALYKNDELLQNIEYIIPIVRKSDANSREPIIEIFLDSLGNKGLFNLTKNKIIVSPKYRHVRSNGRYVFYNDKKDFLVIKKKYLGDNKGCEYEVENGFRLKLLKQNIFIFQEIFSLKEKIKRNGFTIEKETF